MFILFSLLVGLAAAGVSMLVYAAFSAPLGEEDNDGFRLTEPQDRPEATHPARAMTASEFAFFKS